MSSAPRTIYTTGVSSSSFGPAVTRHLSHNRAYSNEYHRPAFYAPSASVTVMQEQKGSYAEKGLGWWNELDGLMDFRMSEDTLITTHASDFNLKSNAFTTLFPEPHLTHLFLRTLTPPLKTAGTFYLTIINPKGTFGMLLDHLKEVQGCLQMLSEDFRSSETGGLLAPSGRRRSGPIRIEAQGNAVKPYDRSPVFSTLLPVQSRIGDSNHYRFPLESSEHANLLPISSARHSPSPSLTPADPTKLCDKPKPTPLLILPKVPEGNQNYRSHEDSEMDTSPETDVGYLGSSPPSVEVVDGSENGQVERDVAATLLCMKA